MLTRFFDFDHTFALMDTLERRFQQPYYNSRGASPRAASRFSELALRDEGDHLTLTAVVPGVPKDDVELSIEGKVLTIKAKQKAEPSKDAGAPREALLFHKQIDLGVRVEGDAASATLEDGILTITLPKAAAAKPTKIQIGKREPPAAQA